MPDAPGIPGADVSFYAAQLKVQAFLATLGGPPVPLGPDELAAYPKRGFAAGWRLPMSFADGVRRLDLLLPIGFPYQPPRVGLVDRPPFLSWPHVEGDRPAVPCAEHARGRPRPAGRRCRRHPSVRPRPEELLTGNFDAEFTAEFGTYWTWAADDQCPGLVSLVHPEPPTRLIAVWRGKKTYILGETPEQIEQWIVNRSGLRPNGFRTDDAALLWIGRPLTPSQYPASGRDVGALAAHAGGEALLAQITRDGPDKLTAVVGVETPSGPALGGAVVAAAVPPRRAGHGTRSMPDFGPAKCRIHSILRVTSTEASCGAAGSCAPMRGGYMAAGMTRASRGCRNAVSSCSGADRWCTDRALAHPGRRRSQRCGRSRSRCRGRMSGAIRLVLTTSARTRPKVSPRSSAATSRMRRRHLSRSTSRPWYATTPTSLPPAT